MIKAIAGLLTLSIGSVAYACSCAPAPPLGEQVDRADNVFAGLVTDVTYLDSPLPHGNQLGTFRVIEVIKGIASGYDGLWANVNFANFREATRMVSSCDTTGLFAGATYMIFAKTGETLIYGGCSLRVQRLRGDHYSLRELAAGEPTP